MDTIEELKTIPWDKIIDLFDSKYTCEIFSRQLDALEVIFKQRQCGATVSEFKQLAFLLDRCIARVLNGRDEFVNPSINIMTIMGLPFIRERSFEEVMNHQLLVDALRLMATPFSRKLLLESRYPELVKAAAGSLSMFLDPARGFDLDLGIFPGRSISLAYDNNINFVLLSESGAVPMIVDCLKRCCSTELEEAYSLCAVLVKVCRDMAFSTCCGKIIVQGSVHEIIPKMLSLHFADALVKDTIHLMWNLLEVGGDEAAKSMLSDDNCIIVLTKTLENMLESGYKVREKEVRNELLAVLLFISKDKHAPSVFVRAGTTVLMLKHCTWSDESKPFNTATKEDFEMYQFMWYIIQYLARDWRNLGIICDLGFINALLDPLRVKNLSAKIRKFSRKQIVTLQNQAIEILGELMDSLLHIFVESHAPQILFEMIYARKGGDLHMEQVPRIMGLINVYAKACTEYPTCSYLKPIATPEVMNGLVELLEDCAELFNPICELVSTITRTFKTCRYSSEKMLTSMIERLCSGGMEPRSQYFALKCAWSCMTNTVARLQQFLDQDGIKCLLVILETSEEDYLLRLTLEVLTDVIACSYIARESDPSSTMGSIALRHLMIWRSLTSKENAITILIKIWERIVGISGKLEKHRIDHFLISIDNPLEERSIGDVKSDIRFLISWLLFHVEPEHLKDLLPATENLKTIYFIAFNLLVERRGWKKIRAESSESDLVALDNQKLVENLETFNTHAHNVIENQQKMLMGAEDEEARSMASLQTSLMNVTKKGHIFGHLSVMASDRVKLSKDQKDTMVAVSLMKEETLNNVLGINND